MEELSAEKFRKFTDVLFDVLGKSDVDVNRLIEAKEAVLRNTEEYKGRSEKELRAIAYSEAVAEMMEPVLTDTDAISRISQKIKQQDRSLWEKIKDFIKGIVEKLKAAYRDMEPDSAIARLTRETVTNSEAVLEAFSDAAADAVLNYNLQETASKGINAENENMQYSFRGVNKNGIEVYETSDEVKSLTYAQRIERFLSVMENDYKGRTAKFVRNGHTYYALFEQADLNKNIYGDKRSDKKGWKAKINAGAEGNIFELVENAKYNGSKAEQGKNSAAHKGVEYWDYFVKNVQIDNTVFDLVANVRKKAGGEYVYSIQLKENKTKEASPPLDSQRALNGVTNASTQTVAQPNAEVKGNFLKSSRDSAGNALTEAQQRYFADSQVRDEDGNLKVVYHGSPAIFTEFSADFMSSHGSSEGQGFYFTDYKPMAEGYQKSGGQLLEGYLNIQKPLSDSEVTLKRAEVRKLLKALDPTGDDLVLNYDSGGGMGYPSRSWYSRALNDTLNAVMGNESDSEILGELANDMGNSGAVLEKVRSVLGYDGYIVSGKYDNANVYVAFDSSQFKNADNQNPTGARDIRYSSRTASDSEYLNLAQNPEENREALSRMVENAAREAGYDSPMLYHGTQSFGFTNFDLDKMDDKRSIFLTSNPDIAATYSGVDGSRNIGKASGTDISTLSLPEVAQMMNQFPPESGMDYQYSVVESKAEISGQVDRGLNELNNLINTLKKQYGKDSKEYGRLEKLQNTLYLGTNDGLSTQLWMILKQTDLFKGHEDFVNGLEQNLRLLKKAPESGSFLVEKALGGYSIDVLSEADAKEELAQNMQRGNYALYARLGNTLTVEGEGQRWNNLKNWARGMEVDENSTYVMEDDGKFFLLRKADDSVVENGVIEATEKARELSPDALQFLLIQKANTSLRILTEAATTTRDVTKWAKNAGYDSVIFKNIKDSGGQNNSVSMDTTADIYAIFNPNNAKSADAVTYDDNGNVIPLSQRFDAGKEDIRYSARNPQAQVEAENERLKTELKYLKKLVQIQKRGNKDFTLDRNSLREAARTLMNANNVKGNVAELAEILDRVYRYAGTEPEITWESFAEKAGEAADWLTENRVKERDPYAQQILDAVAKRRVSLNAEQIGEIEYRYGSLSEFKKAIKGSIILDQNANTSLDQLWQELSGEYPGTFDAGTTDADMPGAFADIVDELRNSESANEAERQYYADEERNQLIRQVYDGYWDVDPVQSVSDKAKKEIDQLKAEHREAIRELKAENRQLKSDAKSQVAAAVREYRQQNNAMTREMKKTYERQLKEVQKGYEKFRSQAESLSSESTLLYQNEFYNALMGTENLGKAKVPELRKKFRELAVENSGKDMDARKARQAEYTRLLDEFLTSRDIGKLRTTIQEQRDRAKAKVEAARVTEQRGKLYRAVNEINRRLMNPTKTLYVPDSLAPAVTKFMQGLTEAMESPKNSWNVQGALETLQGQYQKLTQMNEGVFTQEYNQGILDLLDNAINAVGGTDFNKLSESQIEDVYSAVRSVLTAIRNENKMFAANLNKTYAEAAAAVLREESALPNRKPTTGAVQDKAEKFGWNQLKPVYAMMRLGSDTLLKQYNNLRAGEDKWQRVIAAARAYGLGIMAKYHYDQWNDSLMELDTETGTVELSLEERMSLYAYARREQAFEHLTKGGFVLSDKNTRTVKNRFGIKTEQT